MTISDYPTLANPEGAPRPRGRAVPAYPLYTFKDSGETCRLRRLSPVTMQRLQEAVVKEWKKLPPDDERAQPQPPVEVITIGGAEQRDEPNKQHPDYLEALSVWESRVTSEVMERFIRIAALDACVFEEGVIDAAWCERFERRMAAEGVALNIPDHYETEERNQIIWLIYRCLGTNQDLKEFVQHLINRSEVKQEEVAAHVATFPTA